MRNTFETKSNGEPGAPRRDVNPALPYILLGAFIFSCFLYGGLIASGILRDVVGPVLPDMPVPLPLILGVLALMNIPLALFMGRAVRLEGIDDPASLFAGIVRKLILQSAFLEAIAIYGFVGHILGMAAVPSLIFIGFGLLCLAALIPGLQHQMDRLSKLMRAPEDA